jgi:neurotransmitter:Na+ symporter, NSS family
MTTASPRWRSSTAFIFAAAAAAIGLGNIWRFPFLVGENGGGAFVLMYLGFVLLLGVPLVVAEVVCGRIGRANPVHAMARVATLSGRSSHWRWLGGWGILAGFLILTYYIVICGWVLDYFGHGLMGHFSHITEPQSVAYFKGLTSSPWKMLLTTSIVAVGMIATIACGVTKGLERAVLFMFPAIFVIMLGLLFYAMHAGAFHEALVYLFVPDVSEVTRKAALLALGQAFFSLNIAMGITMAFSAYLPENVSVTKSAIVVVIADTLIALLAGMVIFPIVFAHHLAPSSGPGLIFKTLPIAFGQIPYGGVVAAIFFIMLFFAAFTSVIALLETAVAWLGDQFRIGRGKASVWAGFVCWLLSVLSILSFSHPESVGVLGKTYFQWADQITAEYMLPLGGLMTAIFAGWLLDKKVLVEVLGWNDRRCWFAVWRFLLRVVAPIAILLILVV